MLRFHLQEQRRFTDSHKTDAMMNDHVLDPELSHGLMRNQSQLVRVSELFTNDVNGGLHVGEVVRANEDSAFRFSVIITPNH